jgi:hypothetical protein
LAAVRRQKPSTDAGHFSGGAASVVARTELAHVPEWAGFVVRGYVVIAARPDWRVVYLDCKS